MEIFSAPFEFETLRLDTKWVLIKIISLYFEIDFPATIGEEEWTITEN